MSGTKIKRGKIMQGAGDTVYLNFMSDDAIQIIKNLHRRNYLKKIIVNRDF